MGSATASQIGSKAGPDDQQATGRRYPQRRRRLTPPQRGTGTQFRALGTDMSDEKYIA